MIAVLFAGVDKETLHLVEEAFRELAVHPEVHWVKDAGELRDYVLGEAARESQEGTPGLALIIFDLDLPGKYGLETLAEIRSHPVFSHVPIIVLTNSKTTREDLAVTFGLELEVVIRKPLLQDHLVQIVKALNKYWVETTESEKPGKYGKV